MKRRLTRGMTLVELMMVVAIIGSLASIALPSFTEFVRKARRTEQTVVLAHIEQSVKFRLSEETLPWGAYAASWNPTVVPSRFDGAMPGWREFAIDVEGSVRFSYRFDAIAADRPTFTATVREDIGGRMVYRARSWQLCSDWTLLSDVLDGVPAFPPVEPCAPFESSAASAPTAGSSSSGSGGGGSPGSGSASGGSSTGGSSSSSGSPSSGTSSSGSSSSGASGSGSSGGGTNGSSGNGNSGGNGTHGNNGNHGNGNNGNGNNSGGRRGR
jgi:prepilin-type N-terminal cleavage/methylation domain-containing protein